MQKMWDGLTGVDAEDLDAGEGGDGADPEGEHVGQRGDGDGYRGLLVSLRQPDGHRVLDPGPAPRGQHDERVVNADTCRQRGGQVGGCG